MSIGCCCEDTGLHNKIYGYTGIPYLISNDKFTEPPGSQLNPIYNDKLDGFKYIPHKEGFRYGYEIDGYESWIAVAAGSLGLSLYTISDDKAWEGMPVHSGNYLGGVKSTGNISTADNPLKANTPVFFGDSRGTRYGYEGFNGVYGVCVGKYKGVKGFFAACGKRGVYFVAPGGKSKFVWSSRNEEGSDQDLIRRVKYIDEDIFVFGGAGYTKPSMVFGGTFGQIDFFPEYNVKVHNKFKSFFPSTFLYIRGETHRIGSGAGSVNSIDSKVSVGETETKETTETLFINEKDVPVIAKKEITKHNAEVYIAGSSGLCRVTLTYSKAITSYSHPKGTIGGQALPGETEDYEEDLEIEEKMIYTGAVYSVDYNKGSWTAAVEGGVTFNGGGLSYQTFVKSFCEDGTPLASGEPAYHFHYKDWFSETIRLDGTSASQNLAGGGTFVGGGAAPDADLVIGAFPVSVRGGSVCRWQGGVNTVSKIETNNCETWKKSNSALIRNGYINFQYSLSCVDAYRKGKYTYVIDSLQYIANNMGPGWYTPKFSQSNKSMIAPVELYLNRSYGAPSAGGGILVLE